MINIGFMSNNNLECELSIGKGEKGEDGLTTSISVNGETYTHVDGNIKLPDYPSIKGLATENYVKSEIAKAQLGGEDSEIDLSSYATKDDLSTKADKTELPTKISELINDTNFISGIPSEYITELELDSKGYVTEQYVKNEISKAQLEGEDIDLSAYALKTELHNHNNKTILDEITSDKVNEWNNKSNFDGDYNNLTNKPNIPSVEGLASEIFVKNEIAKAQLEGEAIDLSGYATKEDLLLKADKVHTHSEYLTEHQDISHLSTKSYVDNAIAEIELLEGPQGIQGLQGEKGEKGDKGDKGEQGNTGIDGITPNISIGSVTVLDAGQKATVTRRGTDATPIFDFGIPRGEKGEQGLAGSSYNDTELRELISALTKRIEELEKGNIPPIEDDEGIVIEGSYCGQMAFKPVDTITMEDLERLVNTVDVVKPQTIYAHSGNTVYNKTVICAIPKTQGNIESVIDGAGVDITASYPIIEKEINGTIYMISCNKVAQAYNKSTVVKFNIN